MLLVNQLIIIANDVCPHIPFYVPPIPVYPLCPSYAAYVPLCPFYALVWHLLCPMSLITTCQWSCGRVMF